MSIQMPSYSKKELTHIHDASMDLLKTIGVAFNDDEALGIFKKNGFKVDGKTVFFSEKKVRQAVESAPARFRLAARNPAHTVPIGGDGFALSPGYGATFIITREGRQRKAKMADYDNFCRLVQTSRDISVTGFLMATPSDRPAETAYLDMLYSNITLSDKPFMGSPLSRAAAQDCIEMASMVFGGKEKLAQAPVTASLITPLSPLQYSAEMAGAVITLARYNQACILSALIMAGSSGPLGLAGVLVQQNAEILAGVTLTQLVRPGAPVIIGSTSAIMDMRTGCLSMGAPEVARISSATTQMAKFYNLPARSGSANTDAHFPNAQAGFESATNFHVALQNGSNYILHAAGILGAYNAMSFEKFIIDEEICSQILESLKPVTITDESIDIDSIKEVGIGGNYLTHPKTYEQCRSAFYLSNLVNRNGFSGWQEEGAKNITDKAAELLEERLSAYVKPDIDPQLEKDLFAYVQKTRKKSGRQV
jgi:trimethylamine--corrinoid protein Co-methyltransferase